MTDIDPGDPLAGWQPGAGPLAATDPIPPPAPPQKGVLQTSYNQVPSSTSKGDTFADQMSRDAETQRIRGAFGEGYSVLPESVTRPGERSIFTPETQKTLNTPGTGGWSSGRSFWGPALNLAGDTLGTVVGGATGVGNSIVTLGNEALGNFGVPEQIRRDLNVEASRSPAGPLPELRQMPVVTPGVRAVDAPAMQEFMRPPAPSLSDVLQRQRAAPATDPVTSAAIALLRNGTPTAPPPPAPFTMTPGPQPTLPAPAPSGGLLNIPPAPGQPPPGTGFARAPAPTMTADEILARSQGFYSPADKQAAQGATIGASSADGIRGVLTDAVPTDPQKAAAVGSTPLIQLGKDYQQFQGQPMSYDTAMALDRRLTDERQAALRSGNNTLASQIEDAQGKIRDKVQSVDPSDTTGDPTALAALPQARQAYAQYIKQRQIEDLKYDASLLPDDKQSAYITSRGNAMLRGNQTRNWTDDERGALEQALKSGQPSALTSFGISLIKPAAQATGGMLGGSAFGPVGGLVGGQVGGTLGEGWAAKLRNAARQVTLDPVSQTISQGVPPPVTSAPLPTQPGGINIPRAPTPSGSPAIFSYRNGVPYDAQGNPIAPTPQWQATARRTGLAP